MFTRKRLSLILPVGMGLAIMAAAAAMLVWAPWVGDGPQTRAKLNGGSVAEDISGEDEGNTAHASLENALSGPDAIVGSAYIHYRTGREPEEILHHAPLVVVGTVREAEIAERPTEIDASKIDWPTPAPGEDPKAGPPSVIEIGEYMTRYTVDLEEIIKTSDGYGTPSVVHLLTVGAKVDGEERAFENFPLLRKGERYLLFLDLHGWAKANEDDYALTSHDRGAFLLRDGQAYRPLGPGDSWVPYEEKDQAALLQYLRNEAASLAAAAD